MTGPCEVKAGPLGMKAKEQRLTVIVESALRSRIRLPLDM
jgi:hypothetical protein